MIKFGYWNMDCMEGMKEFTDEILGIKKEYASKDKELKLDMLLFFGKKKD